MSEPTPLLDIAGNDRAVSEQLRRSLAILASRTSDPAARTSIVECLSGQASVRELTSNDSFTAMLDRLLPRGLEEFNALSDEQIARMAADAEADLSAPTDRPGSLRPHPTSDLPPIDDEWPGRKGILSSDW
ncbi:hypothetical protein [Rhodococcus sp. ACT016]|uniref:hypothetical protein n=1 Tax=Rhodococcus sp. ACT016 TaxID=3134808 RepID=UPI003D2DEA04